MCECTSQILSVSSVFSDVKWDNNTISAYLTFLFRGNIPEEKILENNKIIYMNRVVMCLIFTLYSCKISDVCAQDKERGGEMEGKKE